MSIKDERISKSNRHRRQQGLLSSAGVVLIVAAMSLLSLVGCGPMDEAVAAHTPSAYAPIVRDDWEVSSPAEQGLDAKRVARLYERAANMEKLYSVLVVKNGHLVAEQYFNEGSIDQKARTQSVTKSFTSALVGIALDRGCLTSVDQKMLTFFPEVAGQITDPRKEQITIQHMLQMRAGYPWEETHPALWDGLLSGHYPPLVKHFPLTADPGTTFQYSNLTSNWLGIIVDRTCGMPLAEYADEQLFAPLGIEAGEWGTDAEGHNNGCGDLHLTARDMAKFGQLYLDDGVYQGRQVIPAAWVHESCETYSPKAWDNVGRFRDIGYGYQWWSASAGKHQVNFCWGHGGQLIVLVDELDLVVVTTTYPFWLEHNDQSWKHEKATIRMVADFIDSLPQE